MKILILGNAGAGKSTLSRKILARHPAAQLSLDELAFAGGTDRRPLQDSVADVRCFIDAHDSWILEGCYADIIEPFLSECEALIFLNPGIEICVRHCRARPWEPQKFSSPGEQDANLKNLIGWVRGYETRDDEYGLRRHRAIYDAFRRRKHELTHPGQYESALAALAGPES